MSYVSLEDDFHSNPKVLAAGLDGAGLYARALSYCGAYLSDGFLPAEWVRQATAGHAKACTKCVKAGLLRAHEGGFLIPDYLEHNPSREQVLARRAERAESGRKGAAKRWVGRDKSYGSSDGSSHSDSHDDSDGSSLANEWHSTPAPTSEKEVSEAKASSPEKPKRDVERNQAANLISYANRTLGHRWKLTAGRESKIKARLREGYTFEQLCQVIDGAVNDPWDMRTVNNNDDPAILYRDATHVDRFIALAIHPVTTNGSGLSAAQIRAIADKEEA